MSVDYEPNLAAGVLDRWFGREVQIDHQTLSFVKLMLLGRFAVGNFKGFVTID